MHDPIKQAVNDLKAAGDLSLHFIDTTGWLTAENVRTNLVDNLHPNPTGVVYLATKLANAITEIENGGETDAPTITSVAGNPTTWQATDVTLTVNATDTGSGVRDYSFDDGATWQVSNTKIFKANTNGIKIKVRDNLLNISAATVVDITKIDKITPTITVTGNPTAKVKSAVLKIGTTAGLSGKTITVSKDGGIPVEITGTTYTVTANGRYVFTITNGAGVKVTSTVVVKNILLSAPIPPTGNHVNTGILSLMLGLSGAVLTIFAKKSSEFSKKMKMY